MLDAGAGHLGVVMDESGGIELNAFFTLPQRETSYFGPPNGQAEKHLRFPREYLRLSASLKALEAILQQVRHLPRAQQEPALQKCLEANPELLTQGTYDQIWPRAALKSHDPLQRSIIPDFILRNSGNYPAPVPARVLEIKTSEAPLFTSRGFSSFLLNAIDQIRGKYERYFSNPRNHPAQQNTLGTVLNRPRYALLLGRRPDDENLAKLKNGIQRSEWHDLQIITYDDMLDTAAARSRFMGSILQNTYGE
jgi:hypothetical protein